MKTPRDVPATAEYLGTTVRHIRELVAKRAIPYYKVGRYIRFDQDDLDAWLLANRQPARRTAIDTGFGGPR